MIRRIAGASWPVETTGSSQADGTIEPGGPIYGPITTSAAAVPVEPSVGVTVTFTFLVPPLEQTLIVPPFLGRTETR